MSEKPVALVVWLLLCAAPLKAEEPAPLPHTPQSPGDAVAVDPLTVQRLELLRQRFAERDRLQEEIDQLSALTGTAEQVVVKLQILEVNLTACRDKGYGVPATADGVFAAGDAGFSAPRTFSFFSRQSPRSDQASNGKLTVEEFLTAVRQAGLAKVLAEPTVIAVCGAPASISSGGEIPMPKSSDTGGGVEFRKFGAQVELLAESLGNRRVRLNVRPRISNVSASNALEMNGARIPALDVIESNASCVAALGETVVLAGQTQERVVKSRGALGRSEQRLEVALWVVATIEAAGPVDPQLRQASLQGERPQ